MTVYSLDWELTHLGQTDMEYDIDLIVSSVDIPDLRGKLMKPQPIKFESPLLFVANLGFVEGNSDFPVSFRFPVMSHEMIKNLLNVRGFRHMQYPVTLVDENYLEHPYDATGNLKPEVKRLDNFSLVQTLEIFDGLDYQNSVYQPMLEGQLFPTIISKLVIREPESGFPPLFRITEMRSILFVSGQAKKSLEENNIKGCVFRPIEATPFTKSDRI